MRIAKPNGKGGYHKFTNVGLQAGDRVWPMTHGWTDGQVYYVCGFHTDEISGFPNRPHIILDTNHSETKAYQIRTDRGYGPSDCYFKLDEYNK